jgi:putative hemolysin
VVVREDGSWLVDAMIRINDFEDALPDFPLGPEDERDFTTLGGFILQTLGHIPVTGESVHVDGFRVEIVDLDRNRIDKVLIQATRN